MDIDIVGEDSVTQAIIARLVRAIRPDLAIKNRLPARGGQIRRLAPSYNNLNTPVFLLTDLDQYPCPPSLLKDWFGEGGIKAHMLFRVAQEEAETWLMADRVGFSNWLNVSTELIPQPTIIDAEKGIAEIILPIKPSLFLMRSIASQSPNSDLREHLTPKLGAKKGPGYNVAMLHFIEKIWSFEDASNNSTSLAGTIDRLRNFAP